jgi:hypothetical protein
MAANILKQIMQNISYMSLFKSLDLFRFTTYGNLRVCDEYDNMMVKVNVELLTVLNDFSILKYEKVFSGVSSVCM